MAISKEKVIANLKKKLQHRDFKAKETTTKLNSLKNSGDRIINGKRCELVEEYKDRHEAMEAKEKMGNWSYLEKAGKGYKLYTLPA